MSETPSYGALIELISRLEGKDKKTCETALYCLNRLDAKELKLFNEVQSLRAENETLRRNVKTAIMGDSAELHDVKRENEKLRKALTAILNDAGYHNPTRMTTEISDKILEDAAGALNDNL